jgi:hypothetical protein
MPLREVVCPHCFREVFVNTDAKCPACGGNVKDKGEDHADLTLVEFVDGEVLPPVCVVCGMASQAVVEVGERNERRRDDAVSIVSQIVGALAGWMTIPFKPEPYHKEWKISVKLPVCERHKDSRALKPIHVDYGHYRITVPVHADFIAQWKKAGG